MREKTYLVVGGTQGIGASLVERLESSGSRVLTAARSASQSQASSDAIDPDAINWDATKQAFPEDRLPEALDGIAYCPGSINLKPFARLTDADFLADFSVNLLGAVRAIRAGLPSLKRSNSASIVLFSTVAVQTGMPFHASVASAKGAVEGLGRALAAELAPKIRVNVIAPSLTDTPLASRLLGTPERREASSQRHPLGRVGTPEEVAFLAAALLGEEMSWATGQIFHLDGGLSSLR